MRVTIPHYLLLDSIRHWTERGQGGHSTSCIADSAIHNCKAPGETSWDDRMERPFHQQQEIPGWAAIAKCFVLLPSHPDPRLETVCPGWPILLFITCGLLGLTQELLRGTFYLVATKESMERKIPKTSVKGSRGMSKMKEGPCCPQYTSLYIEYSQVWLRLVYLWWYDPYWVKYCQISFPGISSEKQALTQTGLFML